MQEQKNCTMVHRRYNVGDISQALSQPVTPVAGMADSHSAK